MKRSFAISSTGGRLSLVTHFRDNSGTRHTRLLRRYDLEDRELAETERKWLRSIASNLGTPVPVGVNGHFERVGLKTLKELFPLSLPAAGHLLLIDALEFLQWATISASGDAKALVIQTQSHLTNSDRAEFLDWLQGRDPAELSKIVRYRWELPARLKEGKC